MRTDNGFECIDVFANEEQTNNHSNFQETSVVYKFCVNKLQVSKVPII